MPVDPQASTSLIGMVSAGRPVCFSLVGSNGHAQP
jgi:hypothetical protein